MRIQDSQLSEMFANTANLTDKNLKCHIIVIYKIKYSAFKHKYNILNMWFFSLENALNARKYKSKSKNHPLFFFKSEKKVSTSMITFVIQRSLASIQHITGIPNLDFGEEGNFIQWKDLNCDTAKLSGGPWANPLSS